MTATNTAASYTMTATARDLAEGDRFTDHLNQSHTVTDIDTTAGGTRAGIYVYVEGQGHPEFYLLDQEVSLHVPAEVDTEEFESVEGEPRFTEGVIVSVSSHHDLFASEALPSGEISETITGQTDGSEMLTIVSVDGTGDFSYNLRTEDGLRVWGVDESALEGEESHSEARPFRTLTRRYLHNGNCVTAAANFRTREAQNRYAATLPAHTAITSES